MKPMFSPSMMCMDLSRVKDQMDCLNRRTDLYHIDIMDGHFCKNITLSPDFSNMAARLSTLPIDVHLMVTQPVDMIELLHLRPVDTISVHAETINAAAFRTLNLIHDKGCKAGVVLNPATELREARPYLNRIDLLTIMTVDVGFAGQPFIAEMLDKIKEAKALREEKGYRYRIQIDGGCNRKTYRALREAGAEIFVVGNSGLFKLDEDVNAAYDKMLLEFAEETGERV